MKERSALGSTLLLTAVSLFSQGVGFVYRVLLARLVGQEVMGLYQLVLPVLAVLLSLTAIGFTAACSQLSSRWQALGDGASGVRTVQLCLSGFLLAFLAVAAVTVPLSDAISVHLLGDARTRLGLLLLLPCVLLTGVENIHKHYFYGVGRVGPPAASETCEQLVRSGAVLGLLWYFLPRSPERAVGLIVLGMVICEIFSALLLTLLYRRNRPRAAVGGVPVSALRRQVGAIALPVGCTALLGNLMGAATAVMIPRRLVRAGADVTRAMSAFGVLCGMTVPMLSLPTAFLSAMTLVLVPRLAESTALRRQDRARRQVERALNAVALFVIPASCLLAAVAPALGQLLFRTPAAGAWAVPLSLAVVLSCLEGVLHSCLNGLGRQAAAARISLISGAVQLTVTWLRMGLPGVGLRGYVEGMVLSAAVGSWLGLRQVRRVLPVRPRLYRLCLAPGLAGLLAALCARLLLIRLGGASVPAACPAALAAGAGIAWTALAAQGVLTPEPS